MGLIHGNTSGGVLVPLLVDASGRALVATDGTGLIQLAAGTAHIGQVSLDAALPAGTNLLGDVQARNLGYISGAWQKAPLAWGPSDVVRDIKINNSLAVGNSNQDFTTVPAGEWWVVTAVNLLYIGTVTGVGMILTIVNSSTNYYVNSVYSITSGQRVGFSGQWPMKPGENFRVVVVAATAGDTFQGYITGYKMAVNL